MSAVARPWQRPRSLAACLTGLQLGDLGAVDRHVAHQAGVGQHDHLDRRGGRVRIDRAVRAHLHQRDRGVGAGRPAVGGAELVERVLRHEQEHHRLRLRAGLQADRQRGGVEVADRAAAHAQRAVAGLRADDEAGLQHAREHQDAARLGDQLARARHGRIEARERGVHAGVDRLALRCVGRRAVGLVRRGGAAGEREAADDQRGGGFQHEIAFLHRFSPSPSGVVLRVVPPKLGNASGVISQRSATFFGI